MVMHDNNHVGSPGADDELPEDLVALFEQERRHRDGYDRQLQDLDLDVFQQELSRRIQADMLRRFAKNRLVIRILLAVSTIEAMILAVLLIGSPPTVKSEEVPQETKPMLRQRP